MLSQRGQHYLRSLRRIDEWVVGLENFVDYVARQKFFLNQELVRIQVLYSGYRLTVAGSKGDTFLLNFISRKDIAKGVEIYFYEVENGYLIEFGEHASAQFNFYITDAGHLCTWGHEVGAVPNIICSSVEKFIEQYALQNELASQFENPGYYKVLNESQLDDVLRSEFTEIIECSDSYSYWGTNGTLTVVKGTWLHEPTSYLHVYGVSKCFCTSLLQRLEDAGIIA